MLGTIVSIFIIGVLVAFAGYKLYILVNRINPNVSQQTFLRDLNQEGSYKPYVKPEGLTEGTSGFDIAFGVKTPLNASIGYYAVNEVHYYYSTDKFNSDGTP